MPIVRESNVAAILVSDIHLSHKPPKARSAEPDWYAAMERQLEQLRRLAEHYNHVPLVCAGDIFDKWDSPAELINFALEKLPEMYAIPGQHDLPYHNHQEIKKSAFWTLVKTGKIHLLEKPIAIGLVELFGFPFGSNVVPFKNNNKHDDLVMKVAVVHAYIWKDGFGFHGASKKKRVKKYLKKLSGYDVAVFGDNHIGFEHKAKGCRIWNCGGFFRRKSDEIDRKPAIGLLKTDGTIVKVFMDVSKDKFSEIDKSVSEKEEFVESFKELTDQSINFEEIVNKVLEDKKPEIRRIILKAMEKRSV